MIPGRSIHSPATGLHATCACDRLGRRGKIDVGVAVGACDRAFFDSPRCEVLAERLGKNAEGEWAAAVATIRALHTVQVLRTNVDVEEFLRKADSDAGSAQSPNREEA